MGRPAKFSEDQFLDATLHLVAEGGPGAATVAGLAGALEAPVGSIYHRFKSHDLLLARLWIRTVERFQQGYLRALAADDLDTAAMSAALHVVRWARDNVDEARVLLIYRREDLAARWPEELGEKVTALNRAVESALQDYARRRYGEISELTLQRVVFALVDVPYAAGRRFLLAGTAPPSLIDELVAGTCRCILGRTPD
jgi:AcrR family transcriptional regulator